MLWMEEVLDGDVAVGRKGMAKPTRSWPISNHDLRSLVEERLSVGLDGGIYGDWGLEPERLLLMEGDWVEMLEKPV